MIDILFTVPLSYNLLKLPLIRSTYLEVIKLWKVLAHGDQRSVKAIADDDYGHINYGQEAKDTEPCQMLHFPDEHERQEEETCDQYPDVGGVSIEYGRDCRPPFLLDFAADEYQIFVHLERCKNWLYR